MKKTYISPITDNFFAWVCDSENPVPPGLVNGSNGGGSGAVAPARKKASSLYV